MINIVCLIVDIFYFDFKLEITLGLILPIWLVISGLMGWNTYMSCKNLGWEWQDKKMFYHLSYVFFMVASIIGFGLISFSWSNLYLIIIFGVYFSYLGVTYNFYINEVEQYLSGDINEKKN